MRVNIPKYGLIVKAVAMQYSNTPNKNNIINTTLNNIKVSCLFNSCLIH